MCIHRLKLRDYIDNKCNHKYIITECLHLCQQDIAYLQDF